MCEIFCRKQLHIFTIPLGFPDYFQLLLRSFTISFIHEIELIRDSLGKWEFDSLSDQRNWWRHVDPKFIKIHDRCWPIFPRRERWRIDHRYFERREAPVGVGKHCSSLARRREKNILKWRTVYVFYRALRGTPMIHPKIHLPAFRVINRPMYVECWSTIEQITNAFCCRK